ncbi:MAG: hypothetical protein WC554_12955 [Clostridia bacterium]|jgi:hypothetical protein
MAKLDISDINNFTSGLICRGAVSKSRIPTDAVYEAINVNFDTIGCVKTRLGQTRLGNQIQASTNILGLHYFSNSNSTYTQTLAVNGTVTYYLSAGTWTSKRTGLTTGLKSRFTDFLDFVWMVNGTDATAIWSGNPSDSFVTTGNASGAPIGKFIDNFRSRVWIAGNSTYPDRLYYSSVPSAVATPIVTWDTDIATGDWIDISPQDGENITALKRAKDALLVFKENHIYRVYSINETEPDPKINVGTKSQESVVEAKDGVYFHHWSGIYRYADGQIQEISVPVSDYIKAIADYTNICGWADSDHVNMSIGTITVDGKSIPNCVLRYTISSQVWTVCSYPTKPLCSSRYVSTTEYRIVGDNNGNVLEVDTGYDDNGTSIQYRLNTRPFTFDGLFSTRKDISQLFISSDNMTNATLGYKADGELLKTQTRIDTLFKPLSVDVKGTEIEFILSGVTSGTQSTLNGIEILAIDSELIK